MEEEDPVVQEIPVYLSQALAKNLYIFQYPVRPANREWKEVKIKNAAVKPRNKMVRLEVSLDTYSDKYCPSKGEQIALNTDGPQESSWHVKEKDKTQFFKSGVMDKIVFESSTPCTETDHYAVAILQDKELHCTPIQGIIQMRPSYSYYDKQDKRKTEKSKGDSDDEEEKEPEAQQVTVKFARQETEVMKKAREKSYATISQRIAEEPWYDALWKHSDTDHADLECLKLFSATTSDGSALTVQAKEYVRGLVPPPSSDEADIAPSVRPSPQDQIKEILISAKLMTFTDLRAMVRTEDGSLLAESALLSALSGCGCCVRGLWAARSADLYTRAAPVPQRLMCAARDHLLYLFTQHPYVDRRKFAAAVRLPPFEVLHIIQSVAKFNSKMSCWELIIPPDVAFEAKYPDVIQRQNLAWEAKQRQFNEMLMGENVPKRQRKKSQRESTSSDTMMSPKARHTSVSEEDCEVKRPKNKSSTGSGKRTRVSSNSAQDGT